MKYIDDLSFTIFMFDKMQCFSFISDLTPFCVFANESKWESPRCPYILTFSTHPSRLITRGVCNLVKSTSFWTSVSTYTSLTAVCSNWKVITCQTKDKVTRILWLTSKSVTLAQVFDWRLCHNRRHFYCIRTFWRKMFRAKTILTYSRLRMVEGYKLACRTCSSQAGSKKSNRNYATLAAAEPFLSGSSSVYVEEMYAAWQNDPASVHKVSWNTGSVHVLYRDNMSNYWLNGSLTCQWFVYTLSECWWMIFFIFWVFCFINHC